jgi:hypothetical protein
MEEVTHVVPRTGRVLTFWVSKGDAERYVFGNSVTILQNGYVQMSGPKRYLHKVVMGAGPGQMVDHIDGNKLNNCRENLRLCTAGENARNRVGPKRKLPVGVYARRFGNYQSCIHYDRRRIGLGTFATVKAASDAYKAAQLKYHGAFVPNRP